MAITEPSTSALKTTPWRYKAADAPFNMGTGILMSRGRNVAGLVSLYLNDTYTVNIHIFTIRKTIINLYIEPAHTTNVISPKYNNLTHLKLHVNEQHNEVLYTLVV